MEVLDVVFILKLCFFSLTFGSYQKQDIDNWPPPPKWQEKAKMARYVVHYADWGVVSALSPEYGGVPFGTLQSYADGTIDNSTGIPYFYIAAISDTYHNFKYNNSISFTITEAIGPNCKAQNWDPEEPVCSRLTLVGSMIQVKGKSEMDFAKKAVFTRHPDMKSWPSTHDWNFYKLNITAVHLLDFFGGATHVPLDQYYKAFQSFL